MIKSWAALRNTNAVYVILVGDLTRISRNGIGDLDECNGKTVDGSYRYYITKNYPYILGCFRGSPDESFFKGRN